MSESILRCWRERVSSPPGRIVDEDVDGAERGLSRIEEASGGTHIAQICLECDCSTALLCNGGHDKLSAARAVAMVGIELTALSRVGNTQVRHDDGSPAGREGQSCRGADAVIGAPDQSNVALEVEPHRVGQLESGYAPTSIEC